MSPLSPVVANWELVLRLRERRERLGIRTSGISQKLGLPRGYWAAVESEHTVIPEGILPAVFALFEFGDRERERIRLLHRDAQGRGWWNNYSALFDKKVQRLYGLEQNAKTIYAFDTLLIPGLLQTEGYIRAVCDSDRSVREAEVEQLVEARLCRRAVLQSEDPPHVNVIVSEAALRQEIGGPAVHRDQLDYLATVIERHAQHVTIRVIPFSSAACALFGSGTVCLLDFDNPQLPSVAWHESVASWGIIEDAGAVHDITHAFAEAAERAATSRETARLIQTYRDHIPASSPPAPESG